MPLNESSRKPRRERWPLEFDLIGIPRSNAERERLTEQREEQHQMSANRFTTDKLSAEEKANLLNQLLEEAPVGREIDLGKPVLNRYVYREFPKMVYHHENGHVLEVADDKQQKAAQKRGYKLEPSPGHDYSKLAGNNIAAVKDNAPAREEFVSAAELAELDAADEEKD